MDDRGSLSIEVGLVTPVVLLVVLGVVQFALWHHAEQVVIAAAQEAAAVASAESGTPAGAQARAAYVLRGLSSMTEGRQILVEPVGSDRVAVTVRYRLKGLLPGVSSLPLHARSVSRLEQIR